LLRASEPEKNAKLAEALIKLVTGGEPMDAGICRATSSPSSRSSS
jgi:hypothetical protein